MDEALFKNDIVNLMVASGHKRDVAEQACEHVAWYCDNFVKAKLLAVLHVASLMEQDQFNAWVLSCTTAYYQWHSDTPRAKFANDMFAQAQAIKDPMDKPDCWAKIAGIMLSLQAAGVDFAKVRPVIVDSDETFNAALEAKDHTLQ